MSPGGHLDLQIASWCVQVWLLTARIHLWSRLDRCRGRSESNHSTYEKYDILPATFFKGSVKFYDFSPSPCITKYWYEFACNKVSIAQFTSICIPWTIQWRRTFQLAVREAKIDLKPALMTYKLSHRHTHMQRAIGVFVKSRTFIGRVIDWFFFYSTHTISS